MSDALKVLRMAKLKHTPTRKALLEFAFRSREPFTVDQAIRGIQTGSPDPSTAYRNLEHFERLGLIHRRHFGDGVVRYEARPDPQRHHHHIICTRCRKMEILDECALAGFEEKAKALGYSELRHSLEFFGVCPACLAAQRSV